MSEMTPAPVKPAVTMADVEKLDVRVGTIRTVEDVPSSKKLVRMTVTAVLAVPEAPVPDGSRAG